MGEFRDDLFDSLIGGYVNEENWDKAREMLEPDFLTVFDAYVYVLKLTRKQDQTIFYYIGSTESLASRLGAHLNHDGAFAAPMPGRYGEKVVGKREKQYELNGVDDVDIIHQHHGESDREFEARLRNRERQKFAEVAREKDTNNVLGGR